MKIVFLACMALACAPALSQTVYKCKDDKGTTVYSQISCGDDATKMDMRSGVGRAMVARKEAPGAATPHAGSVSKEAKHRVEPAEREGPAKR
jgi:hypothetical protein